jgi:hypothetical protein
MEDNKDQQIEFVEGHGSIFAKEATSLAQEPDPSQLAVHHRISYVAKAQLTVPSPRFQN